MYASIDFFRPIRVAGMTQLPGQSSRRWKPTVWKQRSWTVWPLAVRGFPGWYLMAM